MFKVVKWNITGLISLLIGLYCGAWIFLNGFDEESIRALIRLTATTSVVLFSAAFSASSVHAIFRKKWSAWLLQSRRYIGVSFAASHTYHLVFILCLLNLYPHPFKDKLDWVGTSITIFAYVCLYAMTATSFNIAVKKIGFKRWESLHTGCSYYIFFVFIGAYVPRALNDSTYWVYVGVLALVLVLRIKRRLDVRSKGKTG